MEDLIEVGFWPRIKDKAIYSSGKKRFSKKLLDRISMTAISATCIRTLTRSTCVPLGSSPSPSVFCLAKISLLCHQNTKVEKRPSKGHPWQSK